MKRLIYALVSASAIAFTCSGCSGLRDGSADVMVIAHRGVHYDVPENTMASFDAARRQGIDYLEIDIRPTRDGVLVVFHDAAMDRLTDASGPVSSRLASEIARVRVGEGHAIPTVREVLARFGSVFELIFIDVKQTVSADSLVQTIREQGAQERVVITSTNLPMLLAVRQADPSLRVGYDDGEADYWSGDQFRTDGLIVAAIDNGFEYVLRPFWKASRSDIHLAKARGIETILWTPNSPTSFRQCLELSADGIMTDHPLLLRSLINQPGDAPTRSE